MGGWPLVLVALVLAFLLTIALGLATGWIWK
jgi:hypothetical protein